MTTVVFEVKIHEIGMTAPMDIARELMSVMDRHLKSKGGERGSPGTIVRVSIHHDESAIGSEVPL